MTKEERVGDIPLVVILGHRPEDPGRNRQRVNRFTWRAGYRRPAPYQAVASRSTSHNPARPSGLSWRETA